MKTFTLKFAGNRMHGAKSITFAALDAGTALHVAHREAADTDAELWEGNRRLCTVRRDPVGSDEYWQIFA